jgi:hypothetical protein
MQSILPVSKATPEKALRISDELDISMGVEFGVRQYGYAGKKLRIRRKEYPKPNLCGINIAHGL